MVVLIWLKYDYVQWLKEMAGMRRKAKHNNLVLITVVKEFFGAMRAKTIQE